MSHTWSNSVIYGKAFPICVSVTVRLNRISIVLKIYGLLCSLSDCGANVAISLTCLINYPDVHLDRPDLLWCISATPIKITCSLSSFTKLTCVVCCVSVRLNGGAMWNDIIYQCDVILPAAVGQDHQSAVAVVPQRRRHSRLQHATMYELLCLAGQNVCCPQLFNCDRIMYTKSW